MEEDNSQITVTASLRKLTQIRNELKNIRAQQSAMKMCFKHELGKLQRKLSEIGNHSSTERLSQPSSVSAQLPNHNREKEKQTQFEPIGYIESVYKHKNGIPRQPGICHGTRSKLAISRQNFSNPQHLLLGLNEFSHVWIIFIFHKNKDGFSATKVKPPRLNGAKVGVFATRSPYRPNAIGLTLAQIDKIEDNVVHLLGADILDGTPVIDIKPYIPEYDSVAPYSSSHWIGGAQHVNTASDGLGVNVSLTSPSENLSSVVSFPSAAVTECNREELGCEQLQPEEVGKPCQLGKAEAAAELKTEGKDTLTTACSKCQEAEAVERDVEAVAKDATVRTTCNNYKDGSLVQSDVQIQAVHKCSYSEKSDEDTKRTEGHGHTSLVTCSSNSESIGLTSSFATDQSVQVAEWIRNPPALELTVLFTPRAAKELNRFCSQAEDSNYRLCNFETARDFRTALESILSADPRSIYRRKQCTDRLYYMTLDCIHITCWFDGNTVEVVKVCPANTASRTRDSE